MDEVKVRLYEITKICNSIRRSHLYY